MASSGYLVQLIRSRLFLKLLYTKTRLNSFIHYFERFYNIGDQRFTSSIGCVNSNFRMFTYSFDFGSFFNLF